MVLDQETARLWIASPNVLVVGPNALINIVRHWFDLRSGNYTSSSLYSASSWEDIPKLGDNTLSMCLLVAATWLPCKDEPFVSGKTCGGYVDDNFDTIRRFLPKLRGFVLAGSRQKDFERFCVFRDRDVQIQKHFPNTAWYIDDQGPNEVAIRSVCAVLDHAYESVMSSNFQATFPVAL